MQRPPARAGISRRICWLIASAMLGGQGFCFRQDDQVFEFGVPRLRGFLEQGSPDRLKAELRTGQAFGLRLGQCQDAPKGLRS